MIQRKLFYFFLLMTFASTAQEKYIDYVNPFIGTSNFGATHPGAIAPRGMASVSPFNVAGDQNILEKDSRWLSNPYVYENTFLTGFSHVNMSGVGCPELGVIITMPTTGELNTNHLEYGTKYTNEEASAGYYAVELDKYSVKAEMTSSTRVGVSRYHFPAGKSNILLNLGLGLTNETGAMVKVNSAREVEGFRMVGSFCYNNPESAYPVYFVARLSQPAHSYGAYKTPEKYEGEEAQWMTYNGKTRFKEKFRREVAGDSIGAYFQYNFDKPTSVDVKVGISYVSIENARENLEKEVGTSSFENVLATTREAWNKKLGVVEVKSDDKDDKTVFYTALYHTQIHPNVFNDVNGEYPKHKTGGIGKTNRTRYTTFSLWDTYRNYHQLMSLLYPDEQEAMVQSMLDIYDENGWLPKWELNATETFTMVGDPAAIVIADTYIRGINDFNVKKAYEAMLKSATSVKDNPLRPGLKDYISLGYVTLDSGVEGPVSTTQEYNMADYAIAVLAKKLNKKQDYKKFLKRSKSYQKLYNPKTGFVQAKYKNGSWLTPFDPLAGANFEKNPGYIEGNAWQYLFMQPHDIKGYIELVGGEEAFINKLDALFDQDQFDMANEPDIAYPFLYNYIEGQEHKTQKKVSELIDIYFQNKPAGLPGNDDTGTMSAWVIYAMMGMYPIVPASPEYALSTPQFDEVTIHLNKKYYEPELLKIKKTGPSTEGVIESISLDGKPYTSFFIDYNSLLHSKEIRIKTR